MCERYESLTSSCKAATGERKQLHEVRKCKKWDEFYGDVCLYRA